MVWMDMSNGGLSLGKTHTMIRITKTFEYDEPENEDVYFAHGVYKRSEILPSTSTAYALFRGRFVTWYYQESYNMANERETRCSHG